MNINLTFRQLKAFLLVARLGNFTRAAEQMHVTQAGLSIMMRELESQLDARLFDRTTRFVTLTPAGEQFLPVAKRVVDELEDSANQLGALSADSRRTLRIGVTPLVSTSILPQACRMFRQVRPDVTLKFVDTDSMRVQQLVEAGELDFGLGAFFKNVTGVELTPLFEYELMWVSAPPHELAALPPQPEFDKRTPAAGGPKKKRRKKISWASISDSPLISLPPENKIQQAIETRLEQIGRAHEERQTFRNFETLIAMVAAGMGTAVVPTYARTACLRYGVEMAHLAEPATPLSFYRITKRGRVQANAMADFTEVFIASVPA